MLTTSGPRLPRYEHIAQAQATLAWKKPNRRTTWATKSGICIKVVAEEVSFTYAQGETCTGGAVAGAWQRERTETVRI